LPDFFPGKTAKLFLIESLNKDIQFSDMIAHGQIMDVYKASPILLFFSLSLRERVGVRG